MATTTPWYVKQPRRSTTARRRPRARTRRAPRLPATRFYALLAWSAFVVYVLSNTVITVAGR